MTHKIAIVFAHHYVRVAARFSRRKFSASRLAVYSRNIDRLMSIAFLRTRLTTTGGSPIVNAERLLDTLLAHLAMATGQLRPFTAITPAR